MAGIIQIDNNTWRMEDGFVRFFLLEGHDKAALVDSGVACANAIDIAKSLTNKPIILVNTHGDGDHLSGTGGFSHIHMHPLDYKNCKVGERFPDVKLVEINDGDIIELGDRPLQIIHIPGHTKGSIAILDVSKRILYAGDSVQKGHIFMFGEHRDPEQFEQSLDKLIGINDKYDYIYASHDEYMIVPDYAEKVKESWQMVQKGLLSYEIVNVHGNMVKSYTTSVCGFYM